MEAQERLKKVIDYYQENSNSFAMNLGLKANTKVRHVLNGRNGLSSNFAKKITEIYPEISYVWLLKGDGDMLNNNIQPLNKTKTTEKKLDDQEIPLYDIEVTAGVVTLFKTPQNTKPIDTIKIPNMPKCDGAVTVTGDSMYPLIKSGDIVFYKVIQDLPQSIFFGNMYIVSMDIEGDELVMVKYIQKGKDENHLLLVSENQHHADKEIHIKCINGLALVKGNVRFNFTT